MVKKLSQDQVLHIAKLANLKLSKSEVEKFQEQLGEIIAYVDSLNKVDTKNTSPTFQVTGLKNVFRQDKTEKGLTQEEALFNAKKTHKGYFMVKGILNRQEDK